MDIVVTTSTSKMTRITCPQPVVEPSSRIHTNSEKSQRNITYVHTRKYSGCAKGDTEWVRFNAKPLKYTTLGSLQRLKENGKVVDLAR